METRKDCQSLQVSAALHSPGCWTSDQESRQIPMSPCLFKIFTEETLKMIGALTNKPDQ